MAPPTSRRARVDSELVRRGLARSREQAAELIAAGLVRAGGQTVTKPATAVDLATPLLVVEPAGESYVSRGGHKLAGALRAFGTGGAEGAGGAEMGEGLTITGRSCLDAGASTGGFTDVLLRAGAERVVAVDVGYGQLAWSVRSDPRVTPMDRTNVRTLEPADLPFVPDLVVSDLSFISLALVLPALRRCSTPEADMVLMVKPQFEVGKDRVGAGGVVRDPALRASAVTDVAGAAAGLGLGVRGVTASPLPGPSGNVEYFLWLRAGAPELDPADLGRAIEEGPS